MKGGHGSYASPSGGAQQGLEQPPVDRVAVEEELGVPLDGEQESVCGRFNRFDDSIGSDGARGQRRRHLFDRLVMGTVDHDGRPADNALEQTVRGHDDGMRELGGLRRLPMVQGMLDLGGNILEETASTGHVDGLHASADPQERKVAVSSLTDQVELEIGALRADERERETLAFSVESGREIRTAAGDQKSVHAIKQAPARGSSRHEGENEGNPSEFFDGPDVASPQKIGRLAPAHIRPVTGIIVWGHADDRFHITELVLMKSRFRPARARCRPRHQRIAPDVRRPDVRA